MWIFLTVFLLIYGMMHAVFFHRVRVLFQSGSIGEWCFIGVMIVLILLPVISRVLERMGHDLIGRITAFIAFAWMGFIFLAFVLSAFMLIYDLGVSILAYILHVRMPPSSGKIPVLIMLGVVVVLCVYGTLESLNIRIKHIVIETDKLPKAAEPLRIAQISDVHLGLVAREWKLKPIMEKLKAVDPDILVSTGDLVDGVLDHLPHVTSLLQEFHPKFGKFAITGNHEYYVGLERSLEFLEAAGFTVLRNDGVTIDGRINIAGVDDPHFNHGIDESELLSRFQNGSFTLFLKHQPYIDPNSLGKFDLQLSGHTHGGQIYPFDFVVGFVYKYYEGYYDLPKGSVLYTTSGTGTWGPQMRIYAPPEIVVIELRPSTSQPLP